MKKTVVVEVYHHDSEENYDSDFSTSGGDHAISLAEATQFLQGFQAQVQASLSTLQNMLFRLNHHQCIYHQGGQETANLTFVQLRNQLCEFMNANSGIYF